MRIESCFGTIASRVASIGAATHFGMRPGVKSRLVADGSRVCRVTARAMRADRAADAKVIEVMFSQKLFGSRSTVGRLQADSTLTGTWADTS